MKIRLPETEKKVIFDKKTGVTTTLLTSIEDKTIKFVGIAKCAPEDTFDEEIGAKISYKRARRQMLVKVRNEAREIIKILDKRKEEYQAVIDNLTKMIEELKQKTYDSLN